MATSLEKLVVSLEAESARYQRELDAARKKLGAFEKASNSSLSAIASGFARLVTVGALVAFVKKTVDAGDRLDELSQKTGVSVESLSRLGYAASFSGIGVEELSDSLGKFAKASIAAEHEGKAQAAAFDAIGISVAELDGLSPDEKLLKVAEAFQKFEDGQGKAAVAMALFGKSGADLIPFLNEGAAGIAQLAQESDALGHTMSSETASAFADLSDASDKLFAAFSASLRPAVVELIGPLDSLADLLLDNAKQADVANQNFSQLATTLKGVWTNIILVQTGFELVWDSMAGIGTTVWNVLTGAEGDAPGRSLIKTIHDLMQTTTDAQAQLDALWDPSAPQSLLTGKADDRKSGTSLGQIDFDPSGGGADKAGKDAERAAKAIQSKIDALAQEAAQLGMTSEQQKLYELRTAGATDAQIHQAEALARKISLYELEQERKGDLAAEDERLTSLSKEYMSILDELDGGTRKYNDALAELDTLVKAGNISLEQRTQIAGELEKQMKGLKDAGDFAGEAFQNIRGSTKDLFSDLITDGANWKDHLLDYVGKIGDAFADMAADIATQALFGGSGSGSGGANWGGIIGGLIGALGRGWGGGAAPIGSITMSSGNVWADGGIMPANQWSLVGERGPELVMPHNAARVFNNDDTMEMLGGGGGARNTFNFNIQTPNADSFRPAQKQIQRRARAELGM